MTPEEEGIRAERARQILEDDVFKDAFGQIEQALLNGIRQSAFKDEALREKLCHRYALLHDLVGQLRSTMETGLFADAEARQEGFRERLRSMTGF